MSGAGAGDDAVRDPAGDRAPDEVRRAVDAFASVEVAVVGDLIADRFLWGSVSRISPEAPVPVVRVTREDTRLGGAANVAANVRALGGKARLIGLVGDDEGGRWYREECERLGIDHRGVVVEKGRRTTEKSRVIARHQQVVRFDREDRWVPEGRAATALRRALERALPKVQALVISDYGKGILSEELLAELLDRARDAAVPVLVDPKVLETRRYRGATLVTPNLVEAEGMAGMEIVDDESLRAAGRKILKGIDGEAVLLTRGEEGMSLFQRGRRGVHIPTEARDVYDVTGAGDTVIASMALCEGQGLDRELAARLSNAAAGLVVGKIGTAVVTGDEVLAAWGRVRPGPRGDDGGEPDERDRRGPARA